MREHRMNLIPITPSLGAEVEGLDLTQPLSSEQVRALQSAFETHQVLVFRDQVLSREAHKAFARYFGDIHVHPSKQNLKRDEDPDLFSSISSPIQNKAMVKLGMRTLPVRRAPPMPRCSI